MRCTTSLRASVLFAAVAASSAVWAQDTGNPQQDRDRAVQSDRNMPLGDKNRPIDRATGAMNADDPSRQIQSFAQNPETAGERLFVLGNGEGNLWEIEFSKLVQQRSQDADVKALARQIEQDHTQANQKLQSVAQKLDVELPTTLSPMKQAKLQVFRSFPPEKLDKCYLGMAKADHARDIVAFSIPQNEVRNPELRQYISEVLPKLKQHGDHVQQVASAKGVGGTDISALAGTANPQHDAHRSSTNQPTDADRNTSPHGTITGGTVREDTSSAR